MESNKIVQDFMRAGGLGSREMSVCPPQRGSIIVAQGNALEIISNIITTLKGLLKPE